MEIFLSDWELENLIKELSQGRELSMQLQNHLNVQSSSHENCASLLHEILYSYDQALSVLKNSRPGAAASSEALGPPANSNQDSPMSLASDDSDQDIKDVAAYRKRKAVAMCREKVKLCPETGIEGQVEDDGYNWRKYGQKDILGAKYPRGYYRCTHRHGQGCLATKQVQRSDEDPTIFELTYRRKHTCTPHANPNNNNNPPVILPDPQNKDPNPLLTPNPHESNLKIQTSLRVITQDLGTNFPSPSTINPENNHMIFSDCDNILGNYTTNLLSHAASGSDYFTISTNNIIDDNYEGLIRNLDTSESSELSTNFPFSSCDFGSNSSFGNPGYYP